jgi:hypothetical protein
MHGHASWYRNGTLRPVRAHAREVWVRTARVAVRQIAGVFSQVEKTCLVKKLTAARPEERQARGGAQIRMERLKNPNAEIERLHKAVELASATPRAPTRAAAKAGMTLIGFTRSSPAVSSILTRTLPLGDRTISRCAIGAVRSTFGLRSGRVWRSKMVAAMTRRGPASR